MPATLAPYVSASTSRHELPGRGNLRGHGHGDRVVRPGALTGPHTAITRLRAPAPGRTVCPGWPPDGSPDTGARGSGVRRSRRGGLPGPDHRVGEGIGATRACRSGGPAGRRAAASVTVDTDDTTARATSSGVASAGRTGRTPSRSSRCCPPDPRGSTSPTTARPAACSWATASRSRRGDRRQNTGRAGQTGGRASTGARRGRRSGPHHLRMLVGDRSSPVTSAAPCTGDRDEDRQRHRR